ncbi:inactive protein kinase SELMODRAFT_444075 isoform X2 [Ricinus communis]|nr:inactive protein kinase SELMODRAFT_444075 isoform X2 [Ricinus communis]|eukprot:XP_015571807.1 inactive protein kinase SELMODRAFT_444075 isoform X2 [Ricinus communis]
MNGKSSSGVVLVGKVVVVAVKVSKEISRRALFWALTHVVQPGDCIKLLVVLPAHSSNKRVWGFTKFTSDCTSGNRKSLSGTKLDQRDDISDSCSEMLRHLHDVYDPEKIKIRVKVVSGSSSGVVAAEAKKAQSNWVILDKHLKHETKYCMEELQCNVVVMKRSQPKVLRLNLIGSPMMQPEVSWPLPIDVEASSNDLDSTHSQLDILRGPYVTPASSPDHESSVTITDAGTSSISSSDPGNSPFFLSGIYGSQKKEHLLFTEDNQSLYESESDADSDKQYPPSTRSYYQPWMDDNMSSSGELTKGLLDGFQRSKNAALAFTYKSLLENLSKLDLEPDVGVMNYRIDLNVSKSVREAISLSTHVLPGPPPLCSVCRHKAPVFGNPPKWFTYAELELATDGFSGDNFLAEGGFGSVHRGVLTNGQVVAVKQHKLASSQGDMEFCSEVEVLSCAQHRNVVTLIGFCVEDGRRLLVYEYICNGSLDSHLFGHDKDPLKWSARQKIAVGAARGLRYLHEECRVGCIVHRDMRPNNILITHDFEPLVGDFGLARWQPNGDMGVETRIIGTFG